MECWRVASRLTCEPAAADWPLGSLTAGRLPSAVLDGVVTVVVVVTAGAAAGDALCVTDLGAPTGDRTAAGAAVDTHDEVSAITMASWLARVGVGVEVVLTVGVLGDALVVAVAVAAAAVVVVAAAATVVVVVVVVVEVVVVLAVAEDCRTRLNDVCEVTGVVGDITATPPAKKPCSKYTQKNTPNNKLSIIIITRLMPPPL